MTEQMTANRPGIPGRSRPGLSKGLSEGLSIRLSKALLLPLLLLLGGCGASSVTVEGSYPTPNIPPMPLRLGVYYGEGLADFQYTEYNDRGNPEYIVEPGRSHVTLFNTILPAMFQDVQVLDSPEEASGVDAVFIPTIDEFQLALPQKTRLDVYEVWMRYNMRLIRPDGSLIADWVMTSYGKVQQEALRSAERSINDATVAALRDLGSNFTLSFTRVPEIRDWLQSGQ